MVGAEADLVLGQDHPLRHLTPQRPLLERAGEAGQQRPWEADRDGRPRAEVPGAADDLLRVGVADVDLAELQAIGVRMGLRRDHTADDEVTEIVVQIDNTCVDHALELERRDHEPSRDLGRRRGGLDVLAEPAHRNAHG